MTITSLEFDNAIRSVLNLYQLKGRLNSTKTRCSKKNNLQIWVPTETLKTQKTLKNEGGTASRHYCCD